MSEARAKTVRKDQSSISWLDICAKDLEKKTNPELIETRCNPDHSGIICSPERDTFLSLLVTQKLCQGNQCITLAAAQLTDGNLGSSFLSVL